MLTIWRESEAPDQTADGVVDVGGVTVAYIETQETVTLPDGVWHCTRPMRDEDQAQQAASELAQGAGVGI